MKKLYKAISRQAGVDSNGVHLIHYVIGSMKDSYVPPPAFPTAAGGLFSAHDICAAILAYLHTRFPTKPIPEALGDFGIGSSEDVGRVVTALAEEKRAKMPKLKKQDYDGLFTDSKVPKELNLARWFDSMKEGEEDSEEKAQPLLRKHFGEVTLDSLIISKRLFPMHVVAELQLALDHALGDLNLVRLVGLNRAHNYEGLNFASLLNTDEHSAVSVGPLIYHDMSIGDDETVACLGSGLWLGLEAKGSVPYAVVLGSTAGYSPNAHVSVEVAVPGSPAGEALSKRFLSNLEQKVEQSRCYRGKILSFEQSSDYHGTSTGIKVHQLAPITRDEVILPQRTIELLDRNMIDFIDKRPLLAKRGMNLKKGLLFYGPPGTGKTHTIHYLANRLEDHTILLVNAEQIGLLGEYMTLARLLQPSMVVMEDADLISRDRARMGVCEEVLLNKLLNEMDGLKPDSAILFVLTTNRPEALESALSARPGRIDQAIEFPLPDAEGREKLARLYAGNRKLSDEVVAKVVRATEKTSAAFIKELMRRATQYAVTRDELNPVSVKDIELVIDEMLFTGGSLNRKLLGGNEHGGESD